MKTKFVAIVMAFPVLAASLLIAADGGSVLFPSNPAAQQTCQVNIKPWFPSGSISANAPVSPANSLTFDDATNCNFYKWSWQNFLWLTTQSEGDGGLVLNSSPFFDFDVASGVLSADSGLNIRIEKNDAVKEATGNAYVWGDKAIIYFGVHTNDVWAYFDVLNQPDDFENKEGELDPPATDFPTDETGLTPIVDGAKKYYDATIKDGQTLAMEIKTAWVAASLVPNKADYITIESDVPVYDFSDPTKWTPTGKQQEIELALVGIHIVGSVKGHKEMIWASFEHQDNAPNDTFTYIGTDMKEHSYSNFNTSGATTEDWLFIANGTNKSAIPMSGGNISANNTASTDGTVTSNNGKAITGQHVFRQSPWGTGKAQPTPPAESNTANNTDIISINQNVLGQLAKGDVRANYFLMGATWTNNTIPGTSGAIVKGSQTLANTTMETFFQTNNCFLCHSGTALGNNGLSHIYGKVKVFDPTDNTE